jgi:hypothetical protein
MAEANPKSPGPMQIGASFKIAVIAMMGAGAAGFLLGLLKDPVRAWHAYLVALFYFVSLGLGGVFFAAIQHITRAGWSVTVRRFSESFSAFLPFGAGATVVFLVLGAHRIYEWMDMSVVAHDEVLQHKSSYLNPTFFWIRAIVFFGIWLYFSKRLVGSSVEQDQSGEDSISERVIKPSIIFILLFGLSYTFFSIDLLMSLQPHWFSTIFGIYCFAGLFQSTLAALVLLTIYFMKNHQTDGFVDENHLHDLGKYLMAFTVFWAYIAFSQYMLMWYANLPEETVFFLPRSEGPWAFVGMSLIVFKFIVPFIALLPRWAKRTPNHLVVVSCLILVMQYVDFYWLAYPSMNEHEVVFGLTEILAFVGFLGLFVFAVTRFLSKHSIVAIKDPRIHEALHHHVVY